MCCLWEVLLMACVDSLLRWRWPQWHTSRTPQMSLTGVFVLVGVLLTSICLIEYSHEHPSGQEDFFVT